MTIADPQPPAMRKFHQKTRRGCRQCKSRHIKCDESKPACRKCSRAELPCSFVAELPAPRPWLSRKPRDDNLDESHLTLQLAPGLYTRRVLHDPPVRLDVEARQPFSMLHFRLFHYWEHDIRAHVEHVHPGFDKLCKLYVTHALHHDYLMEELIAYSAAHMSTHVQDNREMYLDEAMKMQTRALALYNAAAPQLSTETCMPMFLYSSLLSHHIVFDVGLNMHDDLGVAIGWLTNSIGIHRGLVALAQATWPILNQEVKDTLTSACHRNHQPVPSALYSGSECQELLVRLKSSDLKAPTLDHLCKTVDVVQDRLSAMNPNDSHSTWAVIQDWLVAIPEEYVTLLNQRRPEALVILAYFSVLLHRAAEHWFVGDLGARLVRLISVHLGPSWAEWLRWPNTVTGNVQPIPAGPYGLLF